MSARYAVQWIVMCTMVGLTGGSAVAAAPLYRAVVLPSIDGGATYAYGLNDLGQVTGNAGGTTFPPGRAAFVWSEGEPLIRIDVPGADTCEGVVINNSGAIAGTWTDFNGGQPYSRIFRRDPDGTIVMIGTLGGSNGEVWDMNESGSVTGWWYDAGGYDQAFVYTDALGLQPVAIPGAYGGKAFDVNNLGQVVGYSYVGGFQRGFIWENGVTTPLGTLGGTLSYAYYANDMGEVVGWATKSSGAKAPFLYSPGIGMQEIVAPPGETWAEAWWNNDEGDVFGVTDGDSAPTEMFYVEPNEEVHTFGPPNSTIWPHTVSMNADGAVAGATLSLDTYEVSAFYFDPANGFQALNDLIVNPPAQGELWEPHDVNDLGQIIINGNGFSALLVPLTAGDMTCDGLVNFGDIDPFVLAITDAAGYDAYYDGTCNRALADTNGDGAINFGDIDPFVAAITGE